MIARTADPDDYALSYQPRDTPCLVVLDSEYRISTAEPRLDEILAEAGFGDRPPERLPIELENVAAELAVASGASITKIIRCPACYLVIRACALTGSLPSHTAVFLERLRFRDPLKAAADRFHLSPREIQVLKLMMRGFGKREIGKNLCIAESTVGEYCKHLYAKIGANSRCSMLVQIFGCREIEY